ncbi:MAG: hypothetical protein Q9172_000634 [Xanthocarpia lactea]
MSDPSSQNTAPPWHDSYPPPKSVLSSIHRTELLHWFQEGEKPGKDFILIDLRRTDHEVSQSVSKGGTIHGSINLPAQSLYPTIPTLYTLFSTAKVEKIVWYCGSSRGRGNRAARWFADYTAEKGDTAMRSYALEEGVKGWALAGEEYVKLMDEYCEAVWTK